MLFIAVICGLTAIGYACATAVYVARKAFGMAILSSGAGLVAAFLTVIAVLEVRP